MTTPGKPAIPAELVDRMVALIGRMAERPASVTNLLDYSLASEIADAFPKPVDPDLIEARKIAANCFRESRQQAYASNVELGYCDSWSIVCATLSAIKRGRELERSANPAHDVTQIVNAYDQWVHGNRGKETVYPSGNSYFDGKRHD